MAVKKTIKVKDTEDLSDSNIEKVIGLLEAAKPCTKKEACGILRIAYNTTRLQSIIDSYKERKLMDAKRRAEKSGTVATESEIQYIVQSYLQGDNVTKISDALYRSATFVNNILTKTGTPRRSVGWSYLTPALVPEQGQRDTFSIGEKVWSARYESLATIRAEVPCTSHPTKVYAIYLLDEKWQQNAYQPAEELCSIQHLTNLGISV